MGLLNRLPVGPVHNERLRSTKLPNRIIREGINSSPRVNALSPAAEIFYRRLLNVVDDYGRYHASPGTLRGACWPTCPDRISDENVAEYLAECAKPDSRDRRLILLYESDGCMFLQVVDFKQQCRSNSKFPEPDINCLANAEQMLSTSRIRSRIRSRISESQSYTPPEPVQLPKINGVAEFPEMVAEIRRHDAAADDHFARRLMQATLQYAMSVPGFPQEQLDAITDHNVARCIAESYRTGPPGHRTGLLLQRVPKIVHTWSLD